MRWPQLRPAMAAMATSLRTGQDLRPKRKAPPQSTIHSRTPPQLVLIAEEVSRRFQGGLLQSLRLDQDQRAAAANEKAAQQSRSIKEQEWPPPARFLCKYSRCSCHQDGHFEKKKHNKETKKEEKTDKESKKEKRSRKHQPQHVVASPAPQQEKACQQGETEAKHSRGETAESQPLSPRQWEEMGWHEYYENLESGARDPRRKASIEIITLGFFPILSVGMMIPIDV